MFALLCPFVISGEINAGGSFSPLSGIKKTLLDNGLTVYVKEDHKLPVVSIHLWVKAGSVDETDRNNGVSHFLEHMLFKGTEKYTVGEISRIVEAHGGVINAGTSKEYTMYYIDIVKAGFNDALNIIAEIAQKATFPEKELESERQVILEEIKRADDSPESVLYDKFNNQLFKVSPYRRRVLGSSETVSSLNRESILSYYRERYTPNNMVLVIAGDVDFDSAMSSVREIFSYLKPGLPQRLREGLIEPVQLTSVEKVKKNVQYSYVLLGFLGPDIDSKNQYSGDALAILLGSGRSSRLYNKLREQKQLVYSIGSGFYSQIGSGVFYVSFLCDKEKQDEVIKEVSYELNKIINDGVDSKELERVKEIVRSNWFFGQETYGQQADIIGYWSLFERLHIVENYLKNIDGLKLDDIKNFLKTYYTNFTITVIDPE